MRQYNRLPIFICLMVLLTACATLNVDLTPKQASAWMNNIYSAQYDEYLTWFDKSEVTGVTAYTLKPNVSEEQVKILNVKKKVLTELEPLLKEYSAYALSGNKTPLIDKVIERAVILVQQLVEMEGGK